VDETVRNAHSLYHETLGELGLIGFGLLALFLGSVIFAAVRSRLRPGGLTRSQTAAVAAALAVWLVHNAFDWDWQMLAVTAPALILAAALLPYGRRTEGAGGPGSRPSSGARGNGRAPLSPA
jgi:O-antigen ligase